MFDVVVMIIYSISLLVSSHRAPTTRAETFEVEELPLHIMECNYAIAF